MPRVRWWVCRRQFPLVASVVLVAVSMASSMWWGPAVVGNGQWQVPDDLWGTLVAAHRLLHLQLGALYKSPTGLVTFPGAALVLVPVVALIEAAGFGLGAPGVQNPHPGSWAFAGPYEIALSATVLFASDAIAEHCGVTRPKRFVLAAAQAVALWNVSARWGHPEDAVAVALLAYGTLALLDDRPTRCAWLTGAAVAVQPLVLLAIPFLIVVLDAHQVPRFLVRVATPATVLVGAALVTDPSDTIRAVGNQPNWPSIDHRTPWTSLSPHMGHGAVAAGPARGIAILLACAGAVFAERRWQSSGLLRRSPDLEQLAWWIAGALALRCVFESVMVAYYVWPVIAFVLVSAANRWSRLVATAVFGAALTFASQLSLRGAWAWWAMAVGLIVLVLFSARGSWRVAALALKGRARRTFAHTSAV